MATAREQDKPLHTAGRQGAGAPAGVRSLRAPLRARLIDLAERERRRVALWAPVLLGLGVWLFFALPETPSAWLVAATVALPAALVTAAVTGGRAFLPPAMVAAGLVSAGFATAAIRASAVEAPVLAEPIVANIDGRVADISRSRSDRRRVVLTDLVIYGLAQSRTPERVRVTVLEGDFARPLKIGERISIYAKLDPPPGPVEPGGFDFRRYAWFERLGGAGYALGPAVAAAPRPGNPSLGERLARLRGELTDGILAALPGREGGFAAAILTGSRAEVRQAELDALRDSNLAHLLAISGLHMGLLAGIVFGVVRLGLASTPLALRAPAKKLAAGAALAAAAAYLALSGASVATQRAFLMAAVALVAVMVDRPAVSLRALAAAALVILLLRPESVFDAGFQMSFAATAALVAVYERYRDRDWIGWEDRPWARRALVFAAGVALTSLVAGLATAPFAAASFNRLTNYGLIANLAAVPIMGLWVAPFGALAAALAPLGLHGPPLQMMGQGIAAILWVAETVAALPGAVRAVGDPPAAVMPLIALGGLWLVIWRTRLRAAGLAPIALGLALWMQGADRPEVLVAPRGEAIGALGPEGRAVDRAAGAGYSVETWLSRDGDGATHAEAALRPGLDRADGAATATLPNGWRVTLLRGTLRPARLVAACGPRTVVITWEAAAEVAGAGGGSDCLVLDHLALQRLGALAIRPDGQGVRIDGALPREARRRWGRVGDGGASAED